jgi:hypothetical protein
VTFVGGVEGLNPYILSADPQSKYSTTDIEEKLKRAVNMHPYTMFGYSSTVGGRDNPNYDSACNTSTSMASCL